MDERAEKVAIRPPPLLDPALATIPREPMICWQNVELLSYINVFMDNLIGLDKGSPHKWRHVHHTIFHSLERFFWNRDVEDPPERNCFLSLKTL